MVAMSRSVIARAVGGALLGLAVLLVAGTVRADAKDDARDAEVAIEEERWDDAIRLLERAIRERPEPRGKGFLGIRRYVPHYLLGLARHGAGDCPGALAALEESERLGEAPKVEDLWPEAERIRTHCTERLAAFQSESEELATRATGLRERFSALAELGAGEAAAVWSEGDPSFEDRHGWIGELLGQAEAGREDALSSFDEGRLVDTDRLLTEATAEIESLETEVRERVQARARAVREDLEEDLDRAVRNAQRILKSVEGLAPYPEGLGARVARVERLLADVRALPRPVPSTAASLYDDLGSAVSRLRRSAQPPPEPLVHKAEAMLAARWGEVLAVDPDEDTSWRDDPRAAAFACWMEAVAMHAQAVLAGDDPSGLDPVRARIASCQEFEDGLVLPESFVSPRFRRLWDEVAAGDGDVAGEGVPDDAEPTSGGAVEAADG